MTKITRRNRLFPIGLAGAAMVLGILHDRDALAAGCPQGKFCYYVPPLNNQAAVTAPTSLVTDAELKISSVGPATHVLAYLDGENGPATPFDIAAAGFVSIPRTNLQPGICAPDGTLEDRGIRIVSDREVVPTLGFYTNADTGALASIKRSTQALGRRFRLGGYELNSGNGGTDTMDFVTVYAPYGASVTLAAPAGAAAPFWADAFAGNVILAPGQTVSIRTIAGKNIDGALLTADRDVSVLIGGKGWTSPGTANGAGDSGADGILPTSSAGSAFVVTRQTGASQPDEFVSATVVADADNTQVRVDGVLVATLAGGGVHRFTVPGPAGTPHFIETTSPATVYANDAAVNAEGDVYLVPPAFFAGGVSQSIPFDGTFPATVTVTIPTAAIGTLRLDGAVAAWSATAVPTRADITVAQLTVTAGPHTISAQSDFQLLYLEANAGTGRGTYLSPFRIPGCGDAVRAGAEACDDGNVADGDGCSSTCKFEPNAGPCAVDSQCNGGLLCDPQRHVCQVQCAQDADCVGGFCVGNLSICRPLNFDQDNDGIPDANEDRNHNGVTDPGESDPTKVDTDGDGLPDGTEDANHNGIVDAAETSPAKADTDGDGIPDGTEDTNHNGVVDAGETDPRKADTDGDGLADGVEDTNHNGVVDAGETDPRKADTDGDGIPDGVEDANHNGVVDAGETDPRKADTDGDGIPDGTEDRNHNGVVDAGETDPRKADTDGDGIPDGDEVRNGFNPLDPADGPFQVDTDKDGVTDGNERTLGLDPTKADTDGDGVPDGKEVGLDVKHPIDTDGDGIIDAKDTDDDGDGLATKDELGPGGVASPRDTDRNGTPDYLNADDDGDGILTAKEIAETTSSRVGDDVDKDGLSNWLDPDADGDGTLDGAEKGDTNSNGVPDYLESSAKDSDGDGVPDLIEQKLGLDPTKADSDGDGVSDGVELGGDANRPRDTDGDGTIDAKDTDDDGDGLATKDELGAGGASRPRDTDGDGKPDYLDADDDGDGVPTKQERADAGAAHVGDDVDGDGQPNWLDPDADGDGVADGAASSDTDGNGVADYLQGGLGSLEGGACSVSPATESASGVFGALALALAGLFGRRRSTRR